MFKVRGLAASDLNLPLLSKFSWMLQRLTTLKRTDQAASELLDHLIQQKSPSPSFTGS